MNAPCVIKQFAPDPQIQLQMQNNPQLQAKMLQLFQREAEQLLALGQHPQIPTLFAYFQANLERGGQAYPYLYLAQEYVSGENLLQALERGEDFAEGEIRNILEQMLALLEMIHQQKVIHRDIKPENIIRRQEDGRLVLIDFGISKQATGTTIQSRTMITGKGTGTMAGTPGYAPSEQMLYGQAYAATDLYALAATCIHLLTGENPLDLYDPLETCWLWRERLQQQGQSVSPQLSQVLDVLLREKPKERYQSATEVLAVLKSSSSPPTKVMGQSSRVLPTILAVPQSQVQSTSTLPTFDFETVTVDRQGREISHRRLQAEFYQEDLGQGITLEMVSIPGGKFTIGSPESEQERYSNEGPQREITIKPFFIGKLPITQAQWQALMGSNPSKFKAANHPVETVTWDDAVAFCQELSKKTGKTYRLPSEAEWEYACRAGTTTPFHFGETITPELVNYDGNHPYGNAPQGTCRKKTTPVGYFQVANNFGLYDMHGNVYEWCADPWHETYRGIPSDGSIWEFGGNYSSRLLRGGSWVNSARGCRSAYRSMDAPGNRNVYHGLRVVAISPVRTR